MGQLPELRVTPSSPFYSVGVDYAGAFHLCLTPGRNPRQIKGYVCVFVCLTVKAVHLELASDLSTPAFLAALDRFVSTRGTPKTIICDGGRNFLGTKNEIMEIQKFVSSQSHLQKVTTFCGSGSGVHLQPPKRPSSWWNFRGCRQEYEESPPSSRWRQTPLH